MTAQKKVALLFIGQTPRPDVTEELRSALPASISLWALGAIDGLDADRVRRCAPSPGENELITKLSDGTGVRLGEQKVEGLLQERIEEAERGGADGCAVLCTGAFPGLRSRLPLLTADAVFHDDIEFDAAVGTVGLLVPMASQIACFASRYEKRRLRVVARAVSPYGALEPLLRAAETLKHEGADCICMDCIGYTMRQAELVSERTRLPVRTPRREICERIVRLLYQ